MDRIQQLLKKLRRFREKAGSLLSRHLQSSQEDTFEYWREKFFINLFTTITIFGLFVYVPSVFFHKDATMASCSR